MGKKTIKTLAIVPMVILLLIGFTMVGKAGQMPHELGKMHKMKATAYCDMGITATNTQTRDGICASKPEWFGKTAIIYQREGDDIGELIGIYKIEDTGGETIQKGNVIDIWISGEKNAKQFGVCNVYVLICDGVS